MTGSTQRVRLAGGTGRAGLALLAIALLLAVGFAACTESAGPLPANVPPVTYLSIVGTDLDTLDYRQVMHWWGSDPDGNVVGYLLKWDGGWSPPPDATRWPADTSFVFTAATTDTFEVPTSGDFAERTFEVHAVDNEDAIDVEGQRQRFKLKNWIPELSFSRVISRPTSSLPAVTFAWSPRDLDGRETVKRYRYWLDGADSTRAPFVPDTVIALTPADFAGRFGERTVKAQAFDESLAPSNVISHTWTVESPSGHYLLIDNVSDAVPGFAREDGFFRAVMDSVVPGDYFIYDVKERGDFRSDKEVYPLLSLFRGVVWYSGILNVANDASALGNFKRAESGLARYLDDGGRVFVSATNAVGDTAGLSLRFAKEHLGVGDLYRLRGQNNIALQRFNGLDIGFVATSDTLGTGVSIATADFMVAGAGAQGMLKLRRNEPTLTGVKPDPTGQEAWIGLIDPTGHAAVTTIPLSTVNRPPGLVKKYGATLLFRLFAS